MAKKELLFITVIGRDTKGIVAHVSQLLYRQSINIEDINQKVIEGFFVMTMLVDMQGSLTSLDRLRAALEKLGGIMKLRIQVQHTNVFKAMHRVSP